MLSKCFPFLSPLLLLLQLLFSCCCQCCCNDHYCYYYYHYYFYVLTKCLYVSARYKVTASFLKFPSSFSVSLQTCNISTLSNFTFDILAQMCSFLCINLKFPCFTESLVSGWSPGIFSNFLLSFVLFYCLFFFFLFFFAFSSLQDFIF